MKSVLEVIATIEQKLDYFQVNNAFNGPARMPSLDNASSFPFTVHDVVSMPQFNKGYLITGGLHQPRVLHYYGLFLFLFLPFLCSLARSVQNF